MGVLNFLALLFFLVIILGTACAGVIYDMHIFFKVCIYCLTAASAFILFHFINEEFS